MCPNLSERFVQSRGKPIRVGDLEVHHIYRRLVSSGRSIQIRRLKATLSPVQALRLKIEKGHLLIQGQALQDVVLWSDTAPTDVEIAVKAQATRAPLKIWNAWRDSEGTMQAWIGDAGMLIDEDGDRLKIRCSDGVGAVCFDDFIVELEFGGD